MHSTLAGMAAVLSFFLLLVLAAKRPLRAADGWLALWFAAQLAFTLALLSSLAAPGGWALPLLLIGQVALLLLAPAQYLYATSALGAPRRIWLHLGIAAVAATAVVSLPFLAPTRASGGAIEVDVATGWILLAPPALLLGSTLYPLSILRLVDRRRDVLLDRLSSLEGADPGWLKLWAYASIALLVSFALLFVGGAMGAWPVELHMTLTMALLLAHLAFVGQRGLTRPAVFYSPASPQRPRAPPPDLAAAASDYARVTAVMETDKPHLDPDLTAQALADQLGWGPERLSNALRHGGGVTFFDAVNAARVRELQALAARPGNARQSLLALAHDAGFGSKSAFYEAFVRHVGSTPAAWRRSL